MPRHVQKLRKLCSSSGETVFQSSKIASGFCSYYAELYNLDASLTLDARTTRLTKIRDYLSMNGLPPLTDDQWLDLESLITTEELEATIKSLPNGKCPGGFTKAYYATFSPILLNPMCRYFNSLAHGTAIPPEVLLAHISVIPKKGKDPTAPQSYRPIFFLNTDVKILANRLKYLILHIIHPDQTGFITGMKLETIPSGQSNSFIGPDRGRIPHPTSYDPHL